MKLNKLSIFIFILFVLVCSNDTFAMDANLKKCINYNAAQQKIASNKLERLYCSNEKIKSIDGISKYSNLKLLSLTNNKITSIPKEIELLKKLEEFDISGNVIYYLPNEINNLKNLKVLRADSTHLLELNNINKLTKLEGLSLKNNQIFTMPNLSNNKLVFLALDGNFLCVKQIKTKNKTFATGKQKKLKTLKNKITLNNKKRLFTLQEELQRYVVDDNDRALNGIKKYLIVDAKNGGKSIDIADYININTGEVYKSGNLSGTVSLDLNNVDIKTSISLKLIVSNDNIVIAPINNYNYQNNINKVIGSNNSKSNKKDSKALFEIKRYDENETFKFLMSKNDYILMIALLISVSIPIFIIIYIIWKIRSYSEDAKAIGI
ncbi:Leucine-rich repeat (LRR) protein [Bacilli bacterium PM5-3]|nr:Leucine-rich repeat (LRR) protein [Bacilli bacterium PM5-3]MDH6604240.1 Leucine-rich repeat (LRR) protein [Bacilli bacterium PM5-9]